jgi:2-polyprenyl-6-methoxyphenol hydroxylase-like FAD-dependent oxidoreductase
MSPPRAYSIAIVGYGIAGIAAAIALRRAGHTITHFEAASKLLTEGSGLLVQPVGLKALRELALYDEVVAIGARVSAVSAETSSGRPLMTVRYDEYEPHAFALGIERANLLALLHARDERANDVRFNRCVQNIDAHTGYIDTSDGNRFGPFDLIIGADGMNSAVRATLPSQLVRVSKRYDTSALVTVLDDPNALATDALVQRFDGARHVSYWRVGKSRVALALNLFDETELGGPHDTFVRHAVSIQPLVAQWFAQQPFEPPFHHYRYADIELHRFTHGRVALIGDAAHAMSPQLGLGASLAIIDALTLAETLVDAPDVASALAMYDEKRVSSVNATQRHSRTVTPLMQSNSLALTFARDRMLTQLARFPGARRAMLSQFL